MGNENLYTEESWIQNEIEIPIIWNLETDIIVHGSTGSWGITNKK